MGGVGNPVARYARRLGRGITLESGDHQGIPESLDHGAGVADVVGKAQRRGTSGMRERARRVRAHGHHGERGAEGERLGDGIAAGPPAIAQRLQDRVCRRLSEIELADDVGEPQPRVGGPRQEFDNVEHPGGRCRRRPANGLTPLWRGSYSYREHSRSYIGYSKRYTSLRLPSVGQVIGLDEVPAALDLARKCDGPRASWSIRTTHDRTRCRQDISDLLVRYATGIDRRDWALFRTVFTDDCELDYGEIGAWQGVEAVAESMEQVHALAGHTMHRLTNQAITVEGDTASARTYVDALMMAGDDEAGGVGVTGVNGIGFYDDDIVRTAEGWRIARRRFTAVRVSTVGSP